MNEEESKNMSEKETKGTNWAQTIISILIGILVTIGATWYTVVSSRQEVVQAETERLNNVKENLVSIIEEHIVNKDSIDLEGFNRLINNRTREEKLYKRPTIYDLLTQAEYNIQSSKHLSFDKKLEYSKIMSSLYGNIQTDSLNSNLSDNRFPEETLKIINYLNETNKSEGKKLLINLAEKYESEIQNLQKAEIKKETIIDNLLRSPSKFILILSIYLTFMIVFWYYYRNRKRKRQLYELHKERTYFEKEKIKKEIEHLVKLMNDKKLTNDERKDMEDRIDLLFNKLEILDKYYSQHRV
jgi:hypothetical protein